MLLVDPDDPCLCGSGQRWAECCARRLPLTLRYVPVRLLWPEDRVMSGCSRGGHCCRNVHVPLTAFDVMRLARSLHTSTGDVLSEWVVVNPEGGVEIDGDPHCPFLVGNDCSVYDLRPDSCRMYPFWSIPVPGGEAVAHDGSNPLYISSSVLVERHTCTGCWQECRTEGKTAGAVVEAACMGAGWRSERLYQDTLNELEAGGVSEAEIEEFMARVYDSDEGTLASTGAGEAKSLEEHFRSVVLQLREEYR